MDTTNIPKHMKPEKPSNEILGKIFIQSSQSL